MVEKIKREERIMLSGLLSKTLGILSLCLALCATASAQYGGGGSGGSGGSASGGSGSTGGYSYGSGKAIGIGVGVAAGAAVGIALLVHHHHAAAHSEASLIGCTQPLLNGISLTDEKDNQTYTIIPGKTPLQPGERVEIKGIVGDEGSATRAFRVQEPCQEFRDVRAYGGAIKHVTVPLAKDRRDLFGLRLREVPRPLPNLGG